MTKTVTKELTSKISNSERVVYLVLAVCALLSLIIVNSYIVAEEDRIPGPITIFISMLGTFVFIFWIIASIRKKEVSRNLMLLFVSSIFSIYFFEKYMEYIDVFPSYEDQKALYTFNRIKALNDELDRDHDAHIRWNSTTISISPQLRLKYDSENIFLSDITDEITILGEEDDGMIIFKSDENGYRNAHGAYDDFDVLLLGDSHTESSFVPDDKTIHFNLQKNGYKTYNAGMGGSGLIHSLATFIEYGIPKKPKFIILNIIEATSISRMNKELKEDKLFQYYNTHESRKLLSKKSEQNKILRELFNRELLKSYESLLANKIGISKSRKRSLFMDYFPQLLRALEFLKGITGLAVTYQGEGVPVCSSIEDSKLHLKNILQSIQDEARSFKGHFFVSYMGGARYANKHRHWDNCEYEMVKSLTNELNITFIDMIQEFEKIDDPDVYFASNYYRNDIKSISNLIGPYGHPNSAGYKVVADKIAHYLDNVH